MPSDRIDLRRVFAERRRALRSIANRVSRQDAEDIVQDAFVNILEVSRVQQILSPEKLLSRIVRRRSIDTLRRKTRRGTDATADMDEFGGDLIADPERALIGSQRLRNVIQTIEAMPPRRKAVLIMHRVREMSYPEIAAQLGISEKAVEKHMRLALKQLTDSDQT